MRGSPVPAIDGPEKPTPSVSSSSRCASGTNLPLATPWMSVNCASSVCTPAARRRSIRSFIATPGTGLSWPHATRATAAPGTRSIDSQPGALRSKAGRTPSGAPMVATARDSASPARQRDQKNTTTEAPSTLLFLRKLPSLTYSKTCRFDQS